MKKFICVAVLILALSTSSVLGMEAVGSAFGTTTTAKTLGAGSGNFGLVAGIADATTFAGTFTYGMSRYIDGRLKLGLISKNDVTKLTFGGDFKYQIWSVNDASSKPFDMTIGGMFEYYKLEETVNKIRIKNNVFQVGGFVLGSYPVQLSNGNFLTPYGRLNFRNESYSEDSKSKLVFGFNAGVSFDLSNNMTAYGEFQIDGNDGVFFGLDFRVL